MREPTLLALIIIVVALFLVTLAFAAYAILLRIHNARRDARRAFLSERWQVALLDAVADPAKIPELHRLVDDDRRLHFVGFVLEFARRMRGTESDTLREVVRPYLDAIADRLESKRVEVRARAVQTLGTLGLPAHASRVVAALSDPSPLVAMVAARSLAKEGDPSYAPALLANVDRFRDWNRTYLASMLAAMGPAVSEALRRHLAEPTAEPWTRAVMAEALQLQSDFASGDVAAAVVESTDDRDLVVEALQLLAEVGRPEHLPVVRAMALHHDPPVRAQALRALGRLGGREDVPTLLAALDDDFTWAALYAARGIREAGGEEVLIEVAAADGRSGRLAEQVLTEGQVR